ncbi:hypothetical protein MnTg04_00289 [bacterium MnTg04]|nr:hypothetical protein MnTg04_00289 [bacterium MnTg04]
MLAKRIPGWKIQLPVWISLSSQTLRTFAELTRLAWLPPGLSVVSSSMPAVMR